MKTFKKLLTLLALIAQSDLRPLVNPANTRQLRANPSRNPTSEPEAGNRLVWQVVRRIAHTSTHSKCHLHHNIIIIYNLFTTDSWWTFYCGQYRTESRVIAFAAVVVVRRGIRCKMGNLGHTVTAMSPRLKLFQSNSIIVKDIPVNFNDSYGKIFPNFLSKNIEKNLICFGNIATKNLFETVETGWCVIFH